MTSTSTTEHPAGDGPGLERGVGRQAPERASACGLTECAGKPECVRCRHYREMDAGWPASADERYLRRLLAVRVGMPHTYFDDGEAHGQEHGISIDFMREPVADIDAKLRALNVARAEYSKPSIEKMLAECVPGGYSCDPQEVADAIRRYCNAWPVA